MSLAAIRIARAAENIWIILNGTTLIVAPELSMQKSSSLRGAEPHHKDVADELGL